ncbi:Retrovirus-related Pol polyprotein from transposon TNT 1-94 [Cinnamomum micranthum f. kanehirae]|uniref:Retrovirus-related Pol polyprotein from transposon TNT 1-94 n=1 Tax=Cinnamomum micranthum f. kanehirae TaxID=337451 RepID=A0A443NX44_9MAGN|nr:Retrovirus-related Pol polyprotein from transposon TNT 1-94 [Cinnamomum micranthum f. kanehirae]
MDKDRQSGKILFRSLSKNGLYPFRVSYPASDISPPAAFVGEQTSSTVWHKRLGHPSVSTLKSLLPALPLHGSITVTSRNSKVWFVGLWS